MRRGILILQPFDFCVKLSLLLPEFQKLCAGVAILSDRHENFQKGDLEVENQQVSMLSNYCTYRVLNLFTLLVSFNISFNACVSIDHLL